MTIYSTLDDRDIIIASPTVVTTGLWSSDTGSLENTLYVNFNDGQQVKTSGEYYLDVYDTDPSADPQAEVQFSIAYGHINGGGAPTLADRDKATLPTKAIYSQYRNLLLDPSDTKFSFKGVQSDHIYVINLQRSRFREQLDPGNWQLPLSGANGLMTFTDDSGQTLGALTANSKAGRVFNIVSGTLLATSSVNADRWGGSEGPGYGLVYPDLGIIVLNPEAIGPAVGFYTSPAKSSVGSAASASFIPYAFDDLNNLNTSSSVYAPATGSLTWGSSRLASYNHAALFVSLNNAIKAPNTRGFQARSAETISSTHYFIRLRNTEFNYSNNPTFYNPSNSSLVYPDFKNNPKTYITSVGLYNDNNELLAVAKLSKPVRKSFNEEVLLRVRLDY